MLEDLIKNAQFIPRKDLTKRIHENAKIKRSWERLNQRRTKKLKDWQFL